MKNIILLFLFLISSTQIFCETLRINVPEHKFQIDHSKSLIVSHLDKPFEDLGLYDKIEMVLGDGRYVHF